MHHNAKEHIPQIPKYQKKDQTTPAAAQIIKQRETAWRVHRAEDAKKSHCTAQNTNEEGQKKKIIRHGRQRPGCKRQMDGN